jgi:uncharacterized protein (TIGR02452 family)
MKRTTRQQLAQETVAIVERGRYTSQNGEEVDISGHVQQCLEATRLFRPHDLDRLRHQALAEPLLEATTNIEVVNETTLSGIKRVLAASAAPVAALNFASAKNPGGGFLNGSQAQEESLARSSALHASLMRAWDFYEQHRASSSLLYSDAMILSPGCPVFRDDEGALLDDPQHVAFLTSAAPNAGAATTNRPEELSAIPNVFRRRSEYVLALAAVHGYTQLVLGAWGCGVFRNDPHVVASAFVDHLRGPWSGRFRRVVFSVLDTSPALETFSAFEAAARSSP